MISYLFKEPSVWDALSRGKQTKVCIEAEK